MRKFSPAQDHVFLVLLAVRRNFHRVRIDERGHAVIDGGFSLKPVGERFVERAPDMLLMPKEIADGHFPA